MRHHCCGRRYRNDGPAAGIMLAILILLAVVMVIRYPVNGAFVVIGFVTVWFVLRSADTQPPKAPRVSMTPKADALIEQRRSARRAQ